MRAVVLVGGQGTRLRPLTETDKKELLPLVDRAILHHTLDRLTRHGVHEVVMSSPYLEEAFEPFIEARHGDPAVTWVTETQALDTGGAIVSSLGHVGSDAFFALNGDILTDLDMGAMAAFHRDRGAAITIALHRVEDARAYGLVATEPDGRVSGFHEKPADLVPGDINAGTYLIDPGALRGWAADEPISIEREIFPRVIAEGVPVYGFAADAYWLDLGTPERYLQATFDLLDGRLAGISYAAPWIDARATVDLRAHLGRHVAVGEGARVGPEAQVDDSVIHPAASVGSGARLVGSIVGARARIGADATIVGCVLGREAWVEDGTELRDARVASFARVPA